MFTNARSPVTRRHALPLLAIELALVAAASVLVYRVFERMIRYGFDHELVWDLGAHAKNAAASNALGIPWGHFLTYLLVSIPCDFCTDLDRIRDAMVIVVALMIALKFAITYGMLRPSLHDREQEGKPLRRTLYLLLCAALVGIAFSLPAGNPYRGQIPPNQWHNSTTATLMPLALLTFWSAAAFLRRPHAGLALAVAAGGIASLTAKPNFAMAFIPAFFLMLLVARLSWRARVQGHLANGAIAVGMAAQYQWMYHSKDFARLRETVLLGRGGDPSVKWGIVVSPFETWGRASASIPLSILASAAFALVVTLLLRRVDWRRQDLAFAWVLVVVAVAIFGLLAETGRGEGTANLRWGAIAAMYVLFVQCLALLLRATATEGWSIRTVPCWLVFALHVASGVFIVLLFLSTGNYVQDDWSQVEWEYFGIPEWP